MKLLISIEQKKKYFIIIKCSNWKGSVILAPEARNSDLSGFFLIMRKTSFTAPKTNAHE